MQLDLESVRSFFGRAPFMVDLGVEPMAVAEGRVSTQMPVATRHLQHTGQVHAGVMAALADHTMGAAAQTLAAEGVWVITAELKTSLLRAARGELLWCEGHVIKPGRNITFAEAEVYAEAGGRRTLVMKASATLAATQAKAD
jgi:uncharacterized protein (TIGR00369 family)